MGSIRGEVELKVCGRHVSIAPTYGAIEAIETRLGIGIPALYMRVLSGDVRIRDIAVSVHEGLRAAGYGGRDGKGEMFSLEEIGEDLRYSLTAYSAAVGAFLGNFLGGGSGSPKDQLPAGGSAPASQPPGPITTESAPAG